MKLYLENKNEEVPGVTSFIFRPEENLSWKAGQFFHYVLHHRPTDERGSDRWFTVSSAPFEGKPMITTRFAPEKGSSFKDALSKLALGEAIEISDLDGDFTVEDLNQEYVLIAGGIGVTPFYSILKELDHQGKKIRATLLYGNRDNNIVFKNQFDEFAKNNPDLKVVYVVAPEQINLDTIKKHVPDLAKPVFYVSGPEPMVEALGKTLKDAGVSDANIKQDWFPGYDAI